MSVNDDSTLSVTINLEVDGIILDTMLDIVEMLLDAIAYLQEQGASEADCLAALAVTLDALLEDTEAHSVH